jgi:sugar/nucleoside kinase (ribokinase family)
MDAAIFGLIVADLIASPVDLRPPPPPGRLVVIQSLEFTTGGNVCNTGTALARFGMKVAAAGLVGKDVLGAAIVERMKAAGLDTSAVVETDRAQTSATLVAVEPGGERVFFHTPGATTLLDAGVFRRCFPLFEKSTFVHIGYFGLLPALTPTLPALLKELKAATARVRVALDTVNPPGDWAQLQPILPHVDVFCPSRTEATALTGESEPRKMVAAFRAFMPRGLIGIKLDVDGCYLDDGATSVHVPAYKIDCVDTTGAGDTWYAGLMAGLIKGMPLAQAGQFANRAAADCCTALGASAGVKSFEDTLARV